MQTLPCLCPLPLILPSVILVSLDVPYSIRTSQIPGKKSTMNCCGKTLFYTLYKTQEQLLIEKYLYDNIVSLRCNIIEFSNGSIVAQLRSKCDDIGFSCAVCLSVCLSVCPFLCVCPVRKQNSGSFQPIFNFFSTERLC